MVNVIPDLELIGKSQCFPLYYYEPVDHEQLSLFDQNEGDYIRRDGVSDFILERARKCNPKISKEDIFYYVYGLLHSSEYRKRFSADLKKMLPRIPFPDNFSDFKVFSKVGRQLAELHLNYENGEPCRSVIVTEVKSGSCQVEKMRFVSKDDKRCIIFNDNIRIENIPLEAYEYVINGRSAIEWLMDRYQITKNAQSQIINNPNQWVEKDSNYILDLLLKIIKMSIDSVNITANLPKLDFED